MIAGKGSFTTSLGPVGRTSWLHTHTKPWAAPGLTDQQPPVVLRGLLLGSLRAPGGPGPSWVLLLHSEKLLHREAVWSPHSTLPLPASYLSHVDAQVLLLICAVADHQAQLVPWLLLYSSTPCSGDEETDNEKPRGVRVGGGSPLGSALTPGLCHISRAPKALSTIPNGTQVPWSPLPQENTQDTHTQRTHGTHGIDTGTRHRLSNTDQARISHVPPQLSPTLALGPE